MFYPCVDEPLPANLVFRAYKKAFAHIMMEMMYNATDVTAVEDWTYELLKNFCACHIENDEKCDEDQKNELLF